MKIEEEDPFGIKNEQLRAIVKAKFERGENFHYRWVPLECLRQVDRLRAIVMKAAKKIAARRSSSTRGKTSSRACARRTSWSSRSAAGARGWSCSRTAIT